MNQFFFLFGALLTMASCGNGESTTKETSSEVKAVEAVASSNEKETPAAPNYLVNGITKKNAGEKKGKVHIFGDITQAKTGQKVYLYETRGKNHYAIDSVKTTGTSFDFPSQTLASGFYMLGLNTDLNMMAFIVNPEEKDIQIRFKSGKLENAPEAINSPENEAWFAYFKEEKTINNAITNLRRSRSKSSFKERIDQQIADKERELLERQQYYIDNNPDTYFAKYLSWKGGADKSDIGKYWSDVDFSDPSLIRANAIPDRIQDFMRTFGGHDGGKFFNAVDVLKEKAAAGENPDVLEFVLYTTADGFYQSGMEDLTFYIIDNHILGEDCGMDPSDMLEAFIKNVNDLQMGNVPPNIVLTDVEGKPLVLHNEVKNNDYTLVMFWASWCHKCEQEIPVLNQFYPVYKPKGFEVVAVSVDQTEPAWKSAIASKQVPGRNVSQLLGWKSPVAQDYKITSTPALFLLDKEGKIVLKPKRMFEVNRFLQENLPG